MKKTFAIIVVIMLVLSLFMTSALAGKPDDKPEKPDKQEKQEQQDDKKEEQEAAKAAREAFKEATAPLISEIHANREEWGTLGEQQKALSDSIEAKIAAIEENGFSLDDAALSAVKDKCAEVKNMQTQVRALKKEIQTLWKTYIDAKKESSVVAGMVALDSLIEKQEARLELRLQIIAALGEIDAALDGAALPGDNSDTGDDGDIGE